MKTIIKWIAGVFLIIGGISFSPVTFWASLPWLIAGIICLPPVMKLINLSTNVKYIFIVVLAGLGFYILINNDKYKKVEEEIAIEKDKERKEQAINEANEDIDKAIEVEKNNKIIVDEKAISDALSRIDKIGSINTLCLGAITEKGYDEMMNYINAKDEIGLDNLVKYGYALQLTKNTKVKVIKTGLVIQQVRILSGKHTGSLVYLPAMVISYNE